MRCRSTVSRRVLEQDLFERLIGVSGIGPKVALAGPVGHRAAGSRCSAIERGDVARLTAIPGVGKKTSERIVLELKDRLPRRVTAAAARHGASLRRCATIVLSALMNLGYHRPLAEKAVDVGHQGDAGRRLRAHVEAGAPRAGEVRPCVERRRGA